MILYYIILYYIILYIYISNIHILHLNNSVGTNLAFEEAWEELQRLAGDPVEAFKVVIF